MSETCYSIYRLGRNEAAHNTNFHGNEESCNARVSTLKLQSSKETPGEASMDDVQYSCCVALVCKGPQLEPKRI